MIKIVGHRGAKGLAPENTLAAITAGIAAGADWIEVDLRVTRDGVPVLCHDDVFRDLAVAWHTLEALRAADARIATLEEAIESVNQQRPLYLDIKLGTPAKPIIGVLQTYIGKGWRPDSFLIASRSQRILQDFKAALPNCPLVVQERWSSMRATWRAKRLGTKYIMMNQRFFWSFFVWSMSRKYHLLGYTLNDPKRAERLAKHGLYGVVTDYPDRFPKAS